MYESLISLLISIVVFPGLLFIVALALFTQWWVRKISARLQNRMGPAYVGPIGLLQPLMDLWKLIHVKEEVIPKNSMPGLAKLFGILGISGAITALAMLPISIYRVNGPYDFLVYMYLCCLLVPLSMIFMSLSMPGPYTAVGVSRILTLITICEPAYFAAILVPVALTSNMGIPYSIYTASVNVWKLWFNPVTLPLMILAFIAAIVTFQAKSMYQPFNIPEAELEIIAGFETEFSGPILGLGILFHDIDTVVTALSITYILLGGPYPYPHTSIPGIVSLILKYMIVVTLSVIIKNAFGRYRIEQALKILFKYALIPGLLAVILAMIYLYH